MVEDDVDLLRAAARELAMALPRVYVTRKLALDPAKVLGPGVVVEQHDSEDPPTREVLLRGVRHASAILATLADLIDAELLAAAPLLRIVANHAVGYDNIDVAACQARRVFATNTPDVLTDATADLAWAMILALARRLREGERLLRSGQFRGWAPTMLLGRELRGSVLGIYGFGRVGRAVAARAEGFGMRVLFHSRSGGVSFNELLAQADVISIHSPLTPATRHAFGAAELARMKRGALLINTARGPIIDEAALCAALEAGQLGGAALDVFEHEPKVHPGLLERDDVVLLPHLGSATQATREEMARVALDDIGRVLRGESPAHPIG